MVRKNSKQLPVKKERLVLFGSVDPIQGTKPNDKESMPDLQNVNKNFLFELDQVGIDHLKMPLQVFSQKKPQITHSIGTFRLTTHLHSLAKGINMSRLTQEMEKSRIEGLNDGIPCLLSLIQSIASSMQQPKAELSVDYDWYYEREAPVTGYTGLNHSTASIGVNWSKDASPRIKLGLSTQVTTLCPCSKEISEYSAHNQRGTVQLSVDLYEDELPPDDWKEQLLEIAESNASSRLHPVLKRPDEKKVTEHAYENPRFVEDLARLCAAEIYELDWVKSFQVDCRNEESIHQHDAVARITYNKETEG